MERLFSQIETQEKEKPVLEENVKTNEEKKMKLERDIEQIRRAIEERKIELRNRSREPKDNRKLKEEIKNLVAILEGEMTYSDLKKARFKYFSLQSEVNHWEVDDVLRAR